ncbi:MAG: amidohydrolase [Acidobacteria bacterium]|nr:MAG: amidohydrolase [Acidobacteriota bacterium]REK02477.1 MAG: amidohydrolase [Acidobacteriota bacterium]REK13721.1 MAG: amidohydrolase [Acidobacteriota bacterium]REK41715.1 MAG: amidohydrolase [Acidobacteriota bacterium]
MRKETGVRRQESLRNAGVPPAMSEAKKDLIPDLRFQMKNTRIILIGLLVLALSSFVAAQNGPADQNLTGRTGTFAITGAKIVTVSGAEIANGTILIRNGKIAAVGSNVSVPSGAEKIDGNGLSVYPGMIDAGTNMGLLEVGNGARGTVDVSETGDVNPNAKAFLGINPHTSHINVTRVNGITTVMSLPVGGLISGQSAIINLNGSTQAEMADVPVYALVINFPTISTFAGFNPFTGPRTINFNQAVKRRDDRVKEIKDIFEAAKQYANAHEAYAKDNSLPYPETDLKMAAMVPYVRGEKPIVFFAQRSRDIRAVLKFVEEMKVKGIIYGGGEAWEVADDLKKHDVPVIYTSVHDNPFNQDDPYDANFTAPSKMQKAGIKFCISTGDNGANARELPYQAGMAGAFGLSKEDALKSVTLFPAEILGISDRYGSLEEGKVANVVVTDGDLLDPRTNVRYLFIEGRMLPLTSRHTEFFERFKDRKAAERVP